MDIQSDGNTAEIGLKPVLWSPKTPGQYYLPKLSYNPENISDIGDTGVPSDAKIFPYSWMSLIRKAYELGATIQADSNGKPQAIDPATGQVLDIETINKNDTWGVYHLPFTVLQQATDTVGRIREVMSKYETVGYKLSKAGMKWCNDCMQFIEWGASVPSTLPTPPAPISDCQNLSSEWWENTLNA